MLLKGLALIRKLLLCLSFGADEPAEFVCRPPPPVGSKEPCRSNVACPCGEFCNTDLQTCAAAACRSDYDCPSYGFSFRFSCRNRVCLPPQNVYAKAFDAKFDTESVPPNVTAVAVAPVAG